MGFSSGISMPLSLDPGINSIGAAIVRAREQQAEVEEARSRFIRMRVAEFVEGDSAHLATVAQYAAIAHRTAFGEALSRLMADGTVEAILVMDDLLRKAAEDIAQAEWISGEPQ